MNVPIEKKSMNKNPETNPVTDPTTDPIFAEAISNFRSSVHAWSQDLLDREITRRAASAPTAHSSRWHWLMTPAVSWSAAALLAIAGAGVPLGLHYHKHGQLPVPQAHSTQSPALSAQPPETTVAQNKADDDKLLEHVDTDIAQDTPDAMQPLASLMSTSGND